MTTKYTSDIGHQTTKETDNSNVINYSSMVSVTICNDTIIESSKGNARSVI